MKLLVLGGTVFLGRHVVEAATARGDEVTIFNRGRHNPDLFPEIERLRGDRDGDLSALEGRRWDAVVDLSGYVPRVVRASAELLADAVEHYTFVSSFSVYADHSRSGLDESAPVATVDDETTEDVDQHYGALKALCEREAERAMRGRALNVRAGLLVGPHDPTNRFTYWVTRIARGGDVLAPEPRDQQVQYVDARDLAEWILAMAEARKTGTFNATGPERPLTMEELLAAIKAATGSDARFVWVGEKFLLEAGVQPWSQLPLWLAPNADPAHAGFLSADVSSALRAGLGFRPLAETVRDTLRWAEGDDRAAVKDYGVGVPRAGLDLEREAELLDAWRTREAA